MSDLFIKTDYIELKNALKVLSIISTGGEAKPFLEEYDVIVNGVVEKRRGRKLYPNDTLIVGNTTYTIKK